MGVAARWFLTMVRMVITAALLRYVTVFRRRPVTAITVRVAGGNRPGTERDQ